jgi:hypothetical protein
MEDSLRVVLVGGVYVGLIILAAVLLFPGSASGDVIVYAETIDRRVHAGESAVITLPNNIGAIAFTQQETFSGVESSGAAYIGASPVWVGDVALGGISIHVYDRMVGDFFQTIWDQYSRPIGYTESTASDGILWGGGASLPGWVAGDGDPDHSESLVLIPWQWELYGPQVKRGVGWVSISHVLQGVPTMGINGAQWETGSGYTIERIALAELSEDLWLGVLPGQPAAVAEPSTVVVGLVVGLGFLWRARKCHT